MILGYLRDRNLSVGCVVVISSVYYPSGAQGYVIGAGVYVYNYAGVFLEQLLRGGEIEIAVCKGGQGHTCVSVYACKC